MDITDELRDRLTALITTHGWAPVVYNDNTREVTVVTTVGLTHRGWPELMVNSHHLGTQALLEMIDFVVQYWEEAGWPITGYPPPALYHNGLVQYRVEILSTEIPAWSEILTRYYAAGPFVPAVAQIFYPDSTGQLPGDAGYQNTFGQLLIEKKVH